MGTEPIESFRNRLQHAMNIRRMRQVELAEKSHLPKASINQYLSGYAVPKTDRIYLMAEALNVDPVWLMGFDVPMEKKKVEMNSESGKKLARFMKDERFFEHIDKAYDLPADKKEALYTYIDFLLSSVTH